LWITLSTAYIATFNAPVLYSYEKEAINQSLSNFWADGKVRINEIGTELKNLRGAATSLIAHRQLKLISNNPLAISVMVSPLYILVNAQSIADNILRYPDTETVVVVTEILCVTVFTAAGILFFFHAYLVSTAQTTVELFESMAIRKECKEMGIRYMSPYSTGSVWNNWKQVLGPNPMKSIWIPSFDPPPPPIRAKFKYEKQSMD
jgi:hypothetical protein